VQPERSRGDADHAVRLVERRLHGLLVERVGLRLGPRVLGVDLGRHDEEPDVRLEIAVRGTRKGHLPGHDESREPEDLLRVLTSKGWAVVDAIEVCASFEDYRQHIQNSRAEWSIAKNAYVAGKAGWFSDRSACYLAAGRPAVLQDTGFQPALPVGEGLLVFSDIDEAAEAIRRVESDHSRHSRAARAIAEQFFNSDKVLSNLLEQAFAQPAETAA